MINFVRRGLKTTFAIPAGPDYRLKIELPRLGVTWFYVDQTQSIQSFLEELKTEDSSIVDAIGENLALQFKVAVEKGPIKFKINSEDYLIVKSEFNNQETTQSVLDNFVNILIKQGPKNKEELIEAASKSLNSIGRQASSHLSNLKLQLKEIEKQISILYDEKNKLESKVNSRSNLLIRLGFVGIFSQWFGFIYTIYGVEWLGWDLMEPLTYSVGQGTFLLGIIYYLKTHQNNSYDNMLHRYQNNRQEYYMRVYGFDLARLKFLEEEKIKLLSSIKLIEKSLYYDFK